MELKYIIYNDALPVIFTKGMNHNDCQWHRDLIEGDRTPTSAGFCSIYVEDGQLAVSVYGESVSLNIKSKPEDAEIILLNLLPKV